MLYEGVNDKQIIQKKKTFTIFKGKSGTNGLSRTELAKKNSYTQGLEMHLIVQQTVNHHTYCALLLGCLDLR